jgi:hypothetical protein
MAKKRYTPETIIRKLTVVLDIATDLSAVR